MKLVSLFLLISALFLTSCAPRVGLPNIFHRAQPVEIELKNFSIVPNRFVVLENKFPVVLHLRNTGGARHDFSLKSPDGALILSKELLPKESGTVRIESLKPGNNYVFYCAFHRYWEMEGMLMVD